MDWLELLYKVLEVCLIPLLGVATTYLIKWLNAKKDEVLIKIDNDMADKYIAMLFETISTCVSATTQTYVDALKKEGKFDAEAQKIAFDKTYKAVLSTLTEEAKEYLTAMYGDLQSFLTAHIEAEVKAQK
jgi:hypothetical protein